MIDDSSRSSSSPDELLTPAEIEDTYKIPRATQAKYRGDGTFCPYLKVGRRVYVRRSVLESWLDSKTTYSTSEAHNARAS